ncbi:MAG: chorismate synthase [Lachnospiraceae bacterium]|nr:chorismate synthase [Lachnospiraceae bacterium]
MLGSSFGTIFTITTWGESHGKGVGVVVDGCPAGLSLQEETIQAFLDRRKPGKSRYSTKRTERDRVQILSGVFEGHTTGTPLSMLVFNTDQRSKDYSEIARCYRPGHADYSFDVKYGFHDYRGGGRSSGRETIGRVAAGAVASQLLKALGIKLYAYTRSIGPISIRSFSQDEIGNNSLYMPDAEAAKEAQQWLESCMQQNNSSGGLIECIVHGMIPGVGDPIFDKLDANLAKAIMSIGAVKGVEIGDGFAAAYSTGADNNDAFTLDEQGRITKLTNHAGGILGGISDGSDIILRAAFKPTPSISSPQKTVTCSGEPTEIIIHGRHDPVVVPRAVVVVEAMTAITLADALLCGMGSRLDNVKKVWHYD